MAAPATPRKGLPWPWITVLLLVVGYSGYYLCRANFSVSKPLLLKAFPDVDKAALGYIASMGTGLYAFGKFVNGSLADLLGGRRLFLFGMAGAICFTLLFGFGGPPLFLMAWCGNRFVQSAGWGGMVKITSRWFGYTQYGRVMAAISLSYLFGDFASRLFLGDLIRRGMDWRGVFIVSAVGLALILVPCWAYLRNSPAERGLPEPEANPIAVAVGEETKGAWDALAPLLRSRNFWTVCVLSFGFTLMRETFNEWTPTYLNEVGKLSEGDAAQASSLFPLFGGFSVILVGFLADRFSEKGRAAILAAGLGLGTLGLAMLASLGASAPGMAVGLVAAIAFVLIGPYSLLAGAVSLDFGGKKSSATAAGWIDGIGYIGGILSGFAFAKLAQTSGWSGAFWALAVVSAASCALAIWYQRHETKGAAKV